MFTEPVKININKEAKTVSISIKATDGMVIVHHLPLNEFRKSVFQFLAEDQSD